jgi:hypothetical protein
LEQSGPHILFKKRAEESAVHLIRDLWRHPADTSFHPGRALGGENSAEMLHEHPADISSFPPNPPLFITNRPDMISFPSMLRPRMEESGITVSEAKPVLFRSLLPEHLFLIKKPVNLLL